MNAAASSDGLSRTGRTLPHITIEQAPINDVYLILDGLLPSASTVRILQDPVGFVRRHEETLREAWRLLRHPIEEMAEPAEADTGPVPDRGRSIRHRRANPLTSLLR